MSVRRAGAVAIIALLAAAVMLAVRPMRYEVDGLSMAPGLMPGDTVATDWLPLADPDNAANPFPQKKVFQYFINNVLPVGLRGIVIAAIASAAASSGPAGRSWTSTRRSLPSLVTGSRRR